MLSLNVFSFIDNLNYSDIPDLELCFSNYSFNIMFLIFLCLVPFFGSFFKEWFLNVNFLYPICEKGSNTLIILISISMCHFLEFKFYLCHQTFIIIIAHLFSNCILPATIEEMYKFPKVQSKSQIIFSPILLSKSADNGLWIAFYKPLQHLNFKNDITIQKYVKLQYFQVNFLKFG